MSDLNSKLMEAKAVFWSMKFYNIVLDFLVGFLFSALVFLLAGIGLLYAVLPALIYSAVRFFKEYRNRSLVRRLEGKYDRLDERLQTAIEYDGMRNVIVEDLVSDVTRRMDAIESSSFLDSKAVSKRVYTLIVLSFILLTAVMLNLRAFVFDSLDDLLENTGLEGLEDLAGKAGTEFDMLTGNRWENSNLTAEDKEKLGSQSGGERPGVSEGPIPGVGGGIGGESNQEIYGEASSASIEGRDVDFRLHPEYGGEIEIRETGGSVRDNTFNLEDVQSAEECVECVIGPEHEEMVRRYFEKILPET